MGLKLTLKPNERVIIGGAVITNGNTVTRFTIENTVPVLRRKDIMAAQEADTACKRLYLTVQLIYIDEQNRAEHQNVYWQLSREIVQAAPSTSGLMDDISNQILKKSYYNALRLAKKLIEYEKEVMARVCKSDASLPER
jgi:flagellar biosynthesis repressor protein FlbT